VPQGTNFLFSIEGRKRQFDGTQAVWWSGSESGTAKQSQSLNAVDLPVWVVVGDTVAPIISGPKDTILDSAVTGVRLRWTIAEKTLASVYRDTNKLISNGNIVSDSISVPVGGFYTATIQAKDGAGNVAYYTTRITRKYKWNGVVGLTSIPWNSAIPYNTFVDQRDQQVYRTITINGQRWMAENLNFFGTDTVLGLCYNNSSDSCVKYGRLYSWNEAMMGSKTSLSFSSKIKGICPNGWHLPSDSEWSIMVNTIGGDLSGGVKLKSISGWNSAVQNTISGSDMYGFRGLPAGAYYGTTFSDVGSFANWWSASEFDSKTAWRRVLYFQSSSIDRDYKNGGKDYRFSVRCMEGSSSHDSTLQGISVTDRNSLIPTFSKSILLYSDTVDVASTSVNVLGIPTDSTSIITYAVGSNKYSSSGNNITLLAGTTTKVNIKVTNANGNTLIYQLDLFRKQIFGSVSDPYGQKYKTVKIGLQTWMAENYNYAGLNQSVGACYGNSSDSCLKYGRLYTWDEIMNGEKSSNINPSGVRGICPVGWHVPSDSEWLMMQNYVDSSKVKDAFRLKASSGWKVKGIDSGNGTDLYGFRALPAGNADRSTFYGIGNVGYWWTATEDKDVFARNRVMYSTGNSVSTTVFGNNFKSYGHSLRCVAGAASQDITLTGLSLGVANNLLHPIFSSSIFSYTDTVENETDSITITGVIDEGLNSVSYAIDSGSYSPQNNIVKLMPGEITVVHIKVSNQNGNSNIYNVSIYRKLSYGFVNDPNGKSYKTVQIGKQIWMAENYNYSGTSGEVGVCYNNVLDSCSKYGRLYKWDQIMNGEKSSSANPSLIKGLCPDGWHVPSDSEWLTLTQYAGGEISASSKLKSLSYWKYFSNTIDPKRNALGFNALPSGTVYESGVFWGSGEYGIWASSTEYEDGGSAWDRNLSYNNTIFMRSAHPKTEGISLRCVKNP
jgi:uncharacterized protein (TIGR02145 family)